MTITRRTWLSGRLLFLVLFILLTNLIEKNTFAQNGAQSSADSKTQAIEFSTVSIRPTKGNEWGFTKFEGDGITITNYSVLTLIKSAYGLQFALDNQIDGVPAWAASEHFDVAAKVAEDDIGTFQKLTNMQRMSMLQSVLAARFKLEAHPITKELPIYALVASKGGPRLKQSQDGDTYADGIKGPDGKVFGAGIMMIGPGTLRAQRLQASNLAKALTNIVGRTVVDKTGLTASYDFTLTWSPEEFRGSGQIVRIPGPDNGSSGPGSVPDQPSLFTALQEQFGLRLESQKGPVDCLMVTHLERPSEN